MAPRSDTIAALADREYQYGFETDIEQDLIPAGVTEDAVRLISAKKDEPGKDRFTLIGFPLKVIGAEASPVRAVALW